MDFGDPVLEPGALDVIFNLAIPQSAFKGDELPLLESLGEFGEIAPSKDAMPFANGGILKRNLRLPDFADYALPNRTVTMLDPSGQALSSTLYLNKITNELQNPRSTSWNIAVERQVLESLNVRVCEKKTCTRSCLHRSCYRIAVETHTPIDG